LANKHLGDSKKIKKCKNPKNSEKGLKIVKKKSSSSENHFGGALDK